MLSGLQKDTKYSLSDTEDALDSLRENIAKAGLSNLSIYTLMCDLVFTNQIKRRLNETLECKVRVYCISGFNFAKRDIWSDSDPYLNLKCGKTTFNEAENY